MFPRRLVALSIASFCWLTLLGLGPAPQASAEARAGRPAPAFRLEGFDGSIVTLARFAGKPLYINVFASWCPPCREEFPRIVSAQRRYGNRVTFLAVSTQEAAVLAKRFTNAMHATFPVAIDRGRMGLTYGARSLPDSYFVDRHGIVRAVVHGPVDAATLDRDLAEIAE
jgi:cytochrome c biogenesis protein CcmG, thiol:disulfide interchange protein DsbE